MPTVNLDVQFNPDSIRALMQIPRDSLEGRIPGLKVETLNREGILEKAHHYAVALRQVILGMKPISEHAEFEKLRDEGAEFGTWVTAQREALKTAK